MKKHILTLSIIILLSLSASAQKSFPAFETVEQFRPFGEIKVWTLIVKDSSIGQLTSVMVGEAEINDQSGYKINQQLNLDYTKIGLDRKININGNFFVTQNGFFLGDDKTITINDNTNSLHLKKNQKEITGYYTRGDEQVPLNASLEKDIFAFDNNFIDQLELSLAMTDITVGEEISVEYIEPQTLQKNSFYGIVEDYSYTQIHTRLADSVYYINIFQPVPMSIYVSKLKYLLKVEIPSQKFKAYLDAVQLPQKGSSAPGFSISTFVDLLPNYFLYLIFAVVAVMLFLGNGYKWAVTYLYFGIGIILYIIVNFIQYPLQEYLAKTFIIPAVQNNESILMLGTLPGLSAGIIQEFVLGFGLFAASQILKSKKQLLIIFGAVLGAGFGFAEGCYLDSIIGMGSRFSWNLLERGFVIAFMASSGAVIGYCLSKSIKSFVISISVLALVNALIRYLPLLVQLKMADAELMYIIVGVISLIVLSTALIFHKKK